jgi:NADH:ubiquinone oxidoreductase subunit 4 (subunit M)
VLGPWYAAIAALGMVFAAMYLLIMVGKVVFGPLREPARGHEHGTPLPADLTWREIGVLTPLAVLCVYIGVQPTPIMNAMAQPIESVLARYEDHVPRPVIAEVQAPDSGAAGTAFTLERVADDSAPQRAEAIDG